MLVFEVRNKGFWQVFHYYFYFVDGVFETQ